MKTKRVGSEGNIVPEEGVGGEPVELRERVRPKWEGFPQPCGWSAKWDFEGLAHDDGRGALVLGSTTGKK
ncbi:MAG: hypothetical protein ACP5HG_06635 [Anaerolineae bacterium]